MPNINLPRPDLSRVAFIGWIILFVVGCSQPIIPNTPLAPTQVTEAPAMPISPTEGDLTQMAPSLPTPADPGLQSLVEKAKADLAGRIAISVAQIKLIEVTEAEWSDSSLGCPQPGMDYLQVITPGYRILMEAGGQTYEYHSNRNSYVVYCENSIPPSSPKP